MRAYAVLRLIWTASALACVGLLLAGSKVRAQDGRLAVFTATVDSAGLERLARSGHDAAQVRRGTLRTHAN